MFMHSYHSLIYSWMDLWILQECWHFVAVLSPLCQSIGNGTSDDPLRSAYPGTC